MDEEARKVCIGDIVYLKIVDLDNPGSGWLCAEGHLNDTIFCSSDSEEFHHGLWEIYAQNQYSSMNEYLEALLLKKLNSEDSAKNAIVDLKKGEKKDQQSEMLHQLEKAAANEQKLNDRMHQSKVITFYRIMVCSVMRIHVFAYLVAQSTLTLVLYISNSSSYRLVHPWFLGTLFSFAMSNQNDFLV
jgi:hypothetical protein